MTRRERMERRQERREEWAEKARAESAGRFEAAHRIADQIPFGQPILVGHHSEQHARRDQNRIHSNMERGVEAGRRADHHAAKADGLARALDTSIFSDDSNAVEALEARIAEREATVARMKALNVAIRREVKAGLAAGWLERTGATPKEQQSLLNNAQFSYNHSPLYPGYAFTNLRGRIRADRARLAVVKTQQARAQRAQESASGVTVDRLNHGFCRVTFAEKPERAVLDTLKAAGFWWKAGSWAGQFDALPAEVKAMAEPLSAVASTPS